MDQSLQDLSRLIDVADRVVLFTGAGISTESAFRISAVLAGSGPNRRRSIFPISCGPMKRGGKPGGGVSQWNPSCARPRPTVATERLRN